MERLQDCNYVVDKQVEILYVGCEPDDIRVNNENIILFANNTNSKLIKSSNQSKRVSNFTPNVSSTSTIRTSCPDIENESNGEMKTRPDNCDYGLRDDANYVPSPIMPEDESDDTNSSSDVLDKIQLNGDKNNDVADTAEYGNMNEGRKRRHRADKNKWKKNENKKLRMEGKQYLGFTKRKGETMKQNEIRPPRSMEPTCTSSACAKSKKRMGEKFNGEERQYLFDTFSYKKVKI